MLNLKSMKNFKLIAFALVMVLFTVTNLFSQGSFSYHFGASVPSGKFADDDEDDFFLDENGRSGGAGLGLNFGVQYVYPLSTNGLGLFVGADITYNPLGKSIRDDIEDGYDADTDITFPKYLNIPLSGGLHYTLKVNDKVSLFGKGGLAVNFLKVTNWKEEDSGLDDLVEKYDLATKLGYTLGGGLVLNDKIELGITYMGIGKHEFDGEREEGSNDEKINDLEVEVGYTTFTIGFRF